MKKTIAQERLTYFTFLWALLAYQEIVHYNRVWPMTPTGFLLAVATILALCRPGFALSLPLLALAGFVHIFFVVDNSLTNLTLESLINFSVIIIWVYVFLRQKTQYEHCPDLYDILSPVLRIYLMGLYFFAVLTKLNTDFFDPRISCAGTFIDNLYWSYPSLFGAPVFLGLKPEVIKMTFVWEILLPVLLLFPRIRALAIGLTSILLTALGWIPGMGIGGMVLLTLILYFSFISDNEFVQLHSWVRQLWRMIQKLIPASLVRSLLAGSFIGATFIYDYFFCGNHFAHRRFMSMTTCTAIVLIYIAVFWKSSMGRAGEQQSWKVRFISQPAVFSLLALSAIVYIGFSPFWGLRTRGHINMFTNLRTLGPRPNHLLIPRSFLIYDPKIVQILDSNNPLFKSYAYYHYSLTDYEFRILANTAKDDFYVWCIYDGKEIVVDRQGRSAEARFLLKPVPWIQQKLMRHAPIDELEHARCQEITNLFRKN